MIPALAAADRRFVAAGLFLARYVGHAFGNGGVVPNDVSTRRCYAALRLAKSLGVRDEYLDLVLNVPVGTIRCRALEKEDEPVRPRPKRKYTRRRV